MKTNRIPSKKYFQFLLAVSLFAVAVSSAALFEPYWHGRERTVYAEWNDWDYTLDGSGNYKFNPDPILFGEGSRSSVPAQAVQLGAPVTGPPVQVLAAFDSRNDVLKVNKSGMYVNLPNFLEGDYTKVHFEISYYNLFSDFSGLTVTAMTTGGVPLPEYNGVLLASQPVSFQQEGNWITAAYEFDMEPSPLWENFVIEFNHYPTTPQDIGAAYIDYFIFETMAVVVPEPATLAVLAAGAVLIRRRK